jgi:glutathione peroxidase
MQFKYLLTGLIALAAMSEASAANPGACGPALNHRMNSLQGQPQDLCQYQGKVVLVVNTASYCGHTPQYQGLEALNQKYAAQGLVVLGFPSNDFGGQEPGSNKEIADFCERTYKVKFPLVEKSGVTEANANPVFKELARSTGEWPKWNFHKYLIDRSGTKVVSFSTKVTPDDPALVKQIEAMLAEP